MKSEMPHLPYPIEVKPGLPKVQPFELPCQEARSLHRRLFAVIEIAGNDECIDLLLKAKIDDILTRRHLEVEQILDDYNIPRVTDPQAVTIARKEVK